MCCVAFNDGLLAVMARTMKSIHFSIMMFWFSAIAMLFILAYLTIYSLVTFEIPTIFTYSYDQ